MTSDLCGVVLMGGQSSRMGTDKSQLLFGPVNNTHNIEIAQPGKKPSDFTPPDDIEEGVVSSSVLRPKEKNVSRTQTTFAQLAHSKLSQHVDTVYYSINQNQVTLGLEKTILDQYENEGPLSGIISALRHTQQSILVLGVDLPLIKPKTIENIIESRNWNLLTTTYYDVESQKWEPMLSIWEIETLPCLEK
ncbi:MAG: molybdenum cofactor guanylyltransferase, partial [Bacteroidia bacterium]